MRGVRARLLLVACLVSAAASCGRIGVDLLPSGDDDPSAHGDGGSGSGSGDDGGASGSGAAGDGVSGAAGGGTGGDGGASGVGGGASSDAGTDAGCSGGDAEPDADGDGVPDCADACPDDADKVDPGVCGCGVAEDPTDTDGDGVADCADACSGPPDDATCDGLDDDCDGDVDEDYAPLPASCGTGACAATGQSSCVGGSEQSSCTPGVPAATDPTCDGINDDCDPGTDEEYVPTPTSCGLGACAASGQLMCSAGATLDTCTPGPAAGSDPTCDGVDEDCNGAADEDYVAAATACGVGACARTGQLICSGGSTQDNCAPGTPAGSDASCDGSDDDCDGDADEDYAMTPTVCGMGSCAATGQLICSGGSVRNTCTSGTPAANDATCDGQNDDCDGDIDEDYVAMLTNCGTGACARTGELICSGGSTQNTCTPGSPAASDPTCNASDDDCDTRTDENYAVDASCGQGYCRTNNTPSSCTGGVESPCQPAAPLDTNDDTADGVDDDCDGTVDENACPTAPVTYASTSLTNISVPSGCSRATVRLWGAGGASGEGGGFWGSATGGRGGPGGFAERTFTDLTTATAIALRIGQAGQNCGMRGVNVNTSYSGGNGATSRSGNGSAGADGTEAGGNGATASSAGDGGRGYFGGGGGGGGGGPAWNPAGSAGGGGAASVLFVASTRLVAGGGGGGGGAGSTIASNGVSGGPGGSGCSGNGSAGAGSSGGGGGGGGKCDGTTNQQGSGRSPYVPAGVSLPAGTATGGNTTSACMAGGNGYAIIQWAP